MAHKSETEKHRCSVLNFLNTQRLEEKLCDVVIKVEEKQFHAHRNVLSASSEYFRSMFTSGFQERDTVSLELKGFRSPSFDRLIEFAYTGRMQVRDLAIDDAVDMLNMAAYLQLKHAVKILSQVLLKIVECDQPDLEGIYQIWKMANLLAKGMDIEDLAVVTIDILAKNLIQFAQTEVFMTDASCEFLEQCLEKNIAALVLPDDEKDTEAVDGDEKGDQRADDDASSCKSQEGQSTEELHHDTACRREGKILDIIVAWLHHDMDNRRKHACTLLMRVQFGYVAKSKLEGLFSTDLGAECRKFIEMVELEDKSHTARGVAQVPVLLSTQKHANKVKIYNINKGTWLDIASFDETPFDGLTKFNSIAIDNHMYICGGIGNSEAKRAFGRYHIYDENPSETILSDMHHPRSDCVLVRMDHYIYAIGGVEAQIDQADFETLTVERYNLNEVRFDSQIFEERVNPWELVEPLPVPCWRPHGIVYKGKILVCGLRSKAPVINHFRRQPQEQQDQIEYILLIYDPDTNKWQRNTLEERSIVSPMNGRQNFVLLHEYQGDCYLIGTTEFPSFRNPDRPWFRLTVNKLKFSNDDSLRFIDVGEAVNQDMFSDNYFSSFFCIGDDLFYRWGKNIIKVPCTIHNFDKFKDLFDMFPNKDSQFVANATLDVSFVS